MPLESFICENGPRAEHISEKDKNQVFVVVFLLIKELYKTLKWSSQAKQALLLESAPNIRKKQLLRFIQHI